MKNQFNKIKSWFGHLQMKNESYDKGGIKPAHDWRIILSTTFFVLIILGAVAGYFYIEVNKGNLFNTSKNTLDSEAQINKPLLDKTIQDIKTRKGNSTIMRKIINCKTEYSLIKGQNISTIEGFLENGRVNL